MKCKDPRKNIEGYSDLTAYRALNSVARAERKEREASGIKSEPQKVYICSPYRDDIDTNIANARRYCRFAVERGKFPIAPHLLLPQFMDDDNPAERELAISFAIRLLYDCQALWIFGTKITEGMKREIAAAKWRGVRIKQFNEKMEEM